MKNYYEGLQKLKECNHLSITQLQNYSWHQKREISAQLILAPDFWVTVDYAISLTQEILKQNKVAAERGIQEILRPLFEQYNKKISKTYQRLSDDEHFFIKNELKTFHHIVTHTINLIDKRVPHLTPRFLFISSIEHLKILAPAGDHCCDPRTLAEKKFSSLFSRHIASQYSQSLVDIIDNLLWQQQVRNHLLPADISLANAALVTKLTTAIKEQFIFDNSSDYRVEQLISELKKVVNVSLIKQSLEEILVEVKAHPAESLINAPLYLDKIAELFISTKTDNTPRFVVRDLTIISRIMNKIKEAVKKQERELLHQQLILGLAMKPMMENVISYLVSPIVGMKMLMAFELIFGLNEAFPSITAALPYQAMIDDLITAFDAERKRTQKFASVTISEEEIELYIDKTMSKIIL
ncbi:hypothetical protein KAH37_01070 [bacterium]|nr:hypothetical protein [bacterium]